MPKNEPAMRIGYGWDSHEFKRGVPLKLGGVAIAHKRGLAGHSDGDVLLHAITDALLGAVAAGDIGTHFPPTDARWKNADSSVFLAEALRHVHRAGYEVANVDSTLILAEPKIKTRFAELGAIMQPGTPAEFGKLVADETEKWGKVVKFAGAKVT